MDNKILRRLNGLSRNGHFLFKMRPGFFAGVFGAITDKDEIGRRYGVQQISDFILLTILGGESLCAAYQRADKDKKEEKTAGE